MKKHLMICVIIVSYNRKSEIMDLLESLKEQRYDNFETLLVDNGSDDQTVDIVRANYPNIKIIEMDENVGPINARNEGIRNSKGEIIVFLDSDVIIQGKEFLNIIAEKFYQDSTLGALGFRIERTGDDNFIDWPFYSDPLKFFYQEFYCTEYNGSGVAIVREALESVGLFEEKYYIGLEEIDISVRLLQQGYEIQYSPKLCLLHNHSLSGRENWREAYYHTRNRIWFAAKLLPLVDALAYVIPTLLFRFFLETRRGYFFYYIKGVLDGITGLHRFLKMRDPIRGKTLKIYRKRRAWIKKFFSIGIRIWRRDLSSNCQQSLSQHSIGYIVQRFPEISNVWIIDEIEELKKRGFSIRPYSINKPSGEELISSLHERYYKETEYIQPINYIDLLLSTIYMFISRTRTFITLLIEALTCQGINMRTKCKHIAYFGQAMSLTMKLLNSNICHLHLHGALGSSMIGMWSARLLGISYSITVHNPHSFYPVFNLNIKLKYAEFIISICNDHVEELTRIGGIMVKDKLHVIYMGIRLSDFPIYYDDKRIIDGDVRLVSAGRLTEIKGFLDLIKALAILEDTKLNFQAAIYGRGEKKFELQKAIIENCITDKVSLMGAVDRKTLARTFFRSHIFILPSHIEGLPVVLMEAMACGLIIIATRINGVFEIIEHGITGYLVEPQNPRAIADTVIEVLKDKQHWNCFRRRGIKRIQERFDISKNVEQRAQLFLNHLHNYKLIK